MIPEQIAIKNSLLKQFEANSLFLYKGSLFKASPFLLSSLVIYSESDELKVANYVLDYDGCPVLLDHFSAVELLELTKSVYRDACIQFLKDKERSLEALTKKIEDSDVKE